ncbi:MAG: hypothetical protein RIG77_09725 [Cyclobacteriaceae bacterium]
MASLIYIIKLLALCFSGVFAAIGVLTDFKKNGKITKWGKIGIVGVVTSTFLGLTIHIVEYIENNKSKLENEKSLAQNIKRQETIISNSLKTLSQLDGSLIEQQKLLDLITSSQETQSRIAAKTDNVLDVVSNTLKGQEVLKEELEGSQLPISTIAFSATFKFSFEDILFSEKYFDRLKSTIDRQVNNEDSVKIILTKKDNLFYGLYDPEKLYIELNSSEDSIKDVTISFKSEYWPQSGNESLASIYLNPFLQVNFIKETDWLRFGLNNNNYDPESKLYAPSIAKIDFFKKKLTLHIKKFEFTFDSKNGQIKNLKDINSSRAFLTGNNISYLSNFTLQLSKSSKKLEIDQSHFSKEKDTLFFNVPNDFF